MVLLDLLGAKNPQIRNTYGHGAALLFDTLPEIGYFNKNVNLN
jgi:hypothetical protein